MDTPMLNWELKIFAARATIWQEQHAEHTGLKHPFPVSFLCMNDVIVRVSDWPLSSPASEFW